MKEKYSLLRFEPLYLTIDKIGPFQEQSFVLDFTNEDGEPCNFYLIASENGRGKTTILDLMTLLMKMLKHQDMNNFGHEGLDRHEGRVQWDILIQISKEGKEQIVVLSLLAGSIGESSLSVWDKDRLSQVGAGSWHRFGFRRHASGRLERIGKNDEFVNDFLSFIRMYDDEPSAGFEDDPLTAPVLLYFSAYRDIPATELQRSIIQPDNWGYKPVHIFAQEGEHWTKSLDNLLVWLSWLGDGRFERARDIVNQRVFRGTQKFLKGIRKSPPQAIVINGKEPHSLDKLSSGEKSLVQLFLRIGTHITRNSILLIDEMDVHLHPKWQHRLLNILKGLLKDHPGLTVIATTHSREILRAFAYEIKEEGLRKGGYIIEKDLD